LTPLRRLKRLKKALYKPTVMTTKHSDNEIEVVDDSVVESIPIFSQLAVLAVILLIIFGVGMAPHFTKSPNAPEETQPAASAVAGANETIPNADHFNDIVITGNSGFVLDVTTQRVLWAENPDMQLPLASVTKLMTALIANELFTSDTDIRISENAIAQDGASGLSAGEVFTLGNLSDLFLLTSSNDGAFAVAESLGRSLDPDDPAAAFVQAMNVRATELGLAQTFFRNPTGLDITEQEAGAYGSARDITILMQHIIRTKPAILEATRTRVSTLFSEEGYTHTAYNTNPFVNQIPGLIGSKTGFTELAGGNLAVAFEAGVNRPVIVVILGSTQEGRFRDILTLTKAAQAALQ